MGIGRIVAFVSSPHSGAMKGTAVQFEITIKACKAEHDHAFAGQPEQLYKSFRGPKTYMKYTAEEHCHFGALKLANRHIFTWLDQVLNKVYISFK